MHRKNRFIVLLLVASATIASAQTKEDKGVGPITSLTLEPINKALVTKGKELFTAKCSACHKVDERYVGPALRDITKRRSPEWIMNMILNPAEMLQKDPTATKLLEEYLTQMTFQDVSKDDVRAILEYFRQIDSGAAAAPAKTKKK